MAIRKNTKDKQRSTKHKHKTKDRVSRTSLKSGDELRCSVINEDYGMLFNFQSCFCGHLFFPQHPGRKDSRTHFNK